VRREGEKRKERKGRREKEGERKKRRKEEREEERRLRDAKISVVKGNRQALSSCVVAKKA